jgi:hypothetical protein
MRGITVTLYERIQSGVDELNHPIYTETAKTVDNVLVAPTGSMEVLQPTNLEGRRGEYQLAIPKGDTHDWSTGQKVSFFDNDWRIIEMPEEGIEWLIPLGWNKKVRVERYEQG